MKQDDCIFCKIASGDAPSYKVWEEEGFLAFLSIFPNSEGVTVVIPKEHHSSYIFGVDDEVMVGLIRAVKKCALMLDEKFDDVGRTAMVFEGFGVDHLHAKLFPMHGTKSDSWMQRKSNVDKYFNAYEGYISSHDYKRANDEGLSALAERLRSK